MNIHVLKTIKWKDNTLKTKKKVLLSFKLTSVFRSWGRRLHHVSRHYAWMMYMYIVEWIYIKHGSVCNLAFIPAVFTCIFECSKKVSAYLDIYCAKYILEHLVTSRADEMSQKIFYTVHGCLSDIPMCSAKRRWLFFVQHRII